MGCFDSIYATDLSHRAVTVYHVPERAGQQGGNLLACRVHHVQRAEPVPLRHPTRSAGA